MDYLRFYYAFGCILFVRLVIVSFVYRLMVPSPIQSVYGFCGTSPILQIFYFCNSNSHTGVDERMGLHTLLGVGYPLQGVVVDAVVLQVYWVLPAVGVLLGLGGVPALVLAVPLYLVPGVLLPVVGRELLVLIVRKVMPIDILLS